MTAGKCNCRSGRKSDGRKESRVASLLYWEKSVTVENGEAPAMYFVPSTKRKRVRTRARSRRVNDAGESRPMPVSAARLASPSQSGKLDRENRKTTSCVDYVLAISRFIYRPPRDRDFRYEGRNGPPARTDGRGRQQDLDNIHAFCTSIDRSI